LIRGNIYYSISEAPSTTASVSGTSITPENKILVVDDEKDIAKLFEFTLKSNGFIVDVFNDPQLALSNYRPGKYNLLLLDVKMPYMDGFELFKRIRKIDQEAKVCFITAFEEYEKEYKKHFPDLRHNCFIKKPIELSQLVNIIRSHLDNNN
jgi:DNA-binding response OmpR family regulator